jgi:DNA-binding NarL/FixJ family response regulator
MADLTDQQNTLRRVLICEDNAELREDYAALLGREAHLNLIGSVSLAGDAISVLKREPVDLVVLDLGLPDASGLEVLKQMRKLQPECEALVVTVFGDEATVVRAIQAGASGYVLKQDLSFNLLRRVDELLAGGSPITPSVARLLLTRLHAPLSANNAESERVPSRTHDELSRGLNIETGESSTGESTAALSDREINVLQLVAKGLSIQEVGDVLQLSANTVKTYVRRIYKKLEVNSRVEAIYEARVLGLLGADHSSR